MTAAQTHTTSTLGIAMIGCGTVGSGVAELLHTQAALYQQRLGCKLELRNILVRDASRVRQGAGLSPSLFTSDADAFFATPQVDVFVEVAGGKGIISQYVRRALAMGKPVVTANKSLLAAEGPELFKLAREHHTALAFEASCAGGIPIITALNFGLLANRIDGLYGILNGTCNYILTEMTRSGKTYATALQEAQAAGYAEADPTLDVSGADTAQKLAVLASLAFDCQVRDTQVCCEGIDQLDLLDIRYAAELGFDIKLLAIAERHDQQLSLRVHPAFLAAELPLAQVRGSFNAVSVYGHATGHTMYQGRGAGKLPTASAVVSDLLNFAGPQRSWYTQAFALRRWAVCDDHAAASIMPVDQLSTRFYLRFNALDVPGTLGRITTMLGQSNISISAVVQHQSQAGQFVPVVITTHHATQGSLQQALAHISSSSVVQGKPVAIRIVDFPK